MVNVLTVRPDSIHPPRRRGGTERQKGNLITEAQRANARKRKAHRKKAGAHGSGLLKLKRFSCEISKSDYGPWTMITGSTVTVLCLVVSATE